MRTRFANFADINALNMDRPFAYDNYVTGKSFVGRKMDCNILGNLLEKGEHVAIYEPPKSGKMSVIQQTLFNMRAAGKQFSVVRVNMFNVRTLEQFLIKFGTAVIRPMYSTTVEYMSVVERYLSGTHFVFDQDRFASHDEVVSLNWSVDKGDVEAMFRLPFMIAAETISTARGSRFHSACSITRFCRISGVSPGRISTAFWAMILPPSGISFTK